MEEKQSETVQCTGQVKIIAISDLLLFSEKLVNRQVWGSRLHGTRKYMGNIHRDSVECVSKPNHKQIALKKVQSFHTRTKYCQSDSLKLKHCFIHQR